MSLWSQIVSAACITRNALSRNSARPMPCLCQLESTARRPSTATGIGSGMLRRKRLGAAAALTAPEASA